MFLRQSILVFALCILFGTELFFFFPQHPKKNYCVLFNGSKYIVQKDSEGRLLLNLCVSSLLVEWKAVTVCL